MPQLAMRGYLIIGAVALGVLIVVVLSMSSTPASPATSPTPQPTMPPITSCVVTVENSVGVSNVRVTNLNTMKSYNATLIDLPLTFRCAPGDQIKFTVTTQEGYIWNAWWFNCPGPLDQTFNNGNPMIVTVYNDMRITPRCNTYEVTS